MSDRSDDARLPGQTLLKLARRLCSERAYERIATPIVADLQSEWKDAIRAGRRARALWVRLAGPLRFWQAMALHAARPGGSAPAELLSGAAALRTLLVATLAPCAVLTLLIWLAGRPWSLPVEGPPLAALARLAALGLPPIVLVTLPMGVLWGTWWAGQRLRTDAASSTIVALALLVGIMALPLSLWLVPRSNQAWRQAAFGLVTGSSGTVPPGDREMTFSELDHALDARSPGLPDARSDGLRVERHKRLAIPVACLPIALLGLACSRSSLLRSLPWLILLSPLVVMAYYKLQGAGEAAAELGHVSAGLAIWLPNLLVGGVAAALWVGSPAREPQSG
jgi:lipopolysaccharide export LptBFGC system permease protein LptF